MTTPFTFKAPRKFREGDQSDLIDITTSYKGAETIWVQLDKSTRKSPSFASEGDLPDPGEHERFTWVLLSADNPNHIMLMDMLSNSRGHDTSDEITETVIAKGTIPEAPNFELTYTDLRYHSAYDYYDLEETHVSESGVVTYKLRPNIDTSWDQIMPGIRLMLEESRQKTKDPIVLEIPAALARYQRHIAVINYIIDNFADKINPYKVVIPFANEV